MHTPSVAVELANDPDLQRIERALNKPPPPDTIALHVVSSPNPILISYQSQRRIILGREISEGDFSAISLSDYHAQDLGVSRQHAVIHILDDGCTIEDLNSTNGTWVNEARLIPQQPHPLQNGDLLRLGHLMIFVSFRE
jgi:pSer/pThr/pTyr-binding forkhead associated (FHA) protein